MRSPVPSRVLKKVMFWEDVVSTGLPEVVTGPAKEIVLAVDVIDPLTRELPEEPCVKAPATVHVAFMVNSPVLLTVKGPLEVVVRELLTVNALPTKLTPLDVLVFVGPLRVVSPVPLSWL